MPAQFGTLILTVSYDQATYTISCTGEAFGINQYAGVSNIEVSASGSGTWTSVAAITIWGDEAVAGTLASDLSSGNYDVRVTSSDAEQDTYENAIIIPAGDNMIIDNISQILFEYGVM
jgi:hypothetical protein